MKDQTYFIINLAVRLAITILAARVLVLVDSELANLMLLMGIES